MLLCTALETARNFAKKIGDKYYRVVSNEYPSAMEAIMRRLYWTGSDLGFGKWTFYLLMTSADFCDCAVMSFIFLKLLNISATILIQNETRIILLNRFLVLCTQSKQQ